MVRGSGWVQGAVGAGLWLLATGGACAQTAETTAGDGNNSAAARASDAGDANNTTASTASATAGSGDANATLGGLGALSGLGNLLLPNFPLPANLGDLAKELADPNLLLAIKSALDNQVCQSELDALNTQSQAITDQLAKNPGALLGSLGAAGSSGSSPSDALPDLQPITDAANAFLKCMVNAVPSLGQAIGNVSKLTTSRLVAEDAGGAGTAAGTSAYATLSALSAPRVLAAVQRASQAGTCPAELQALGAAAAPVFTGLGGVADGASPRPAAEVRAATAAMDALVQCAEAH